MKKYLLDTHTVIWASSTPKKLSNKCRFILEREKCELFFSLASIWEISIKSNLGKLKLPVRCEEFIANMQSDIGFNLLSIELPHLYTVEKLPKQHGDPFDRLLVSQAKQEKLSIVSQDKSFDYYDVVRVW